MQSLDAYTHGATGAPGNESRTLDPRHAASEDLVTPKLKRAVRLSPSPAMAMPIGSVGDGYYRGNSMGDARVMNWKRKAPPKKLKSALKHHIKEVNEAFEAEQFTARTPKSALSRRQPPSRQLYPQYIYNRQGLPSRVHGLYEE